ncbi:MAG: ABC transporter permease [Cytophagales bacterium]|nr:ABC transporter permease [Cytophagales bacterium]
MHKISYIIKREYLSRVKKKSFLMMTFLGPLIMSVMMMGPVWFAQLDNEPVHKVLIADESTLFENVFSNTKNLHFIRMEKAYVQAKSLFHASPEIQTLVHIPSNLSSEIEVYTKSNHEVYYRYIESTVKQKIYEHYIRGEIPINVKRVKIEVQSYEKANVVKQVLSYMGVILIYFFIFLYGIQVMKGVIEEKSNRIVEVMISVVKPFHLMIGKIVGICLLGLTQFLIWAGLSGGITYTLANYFQLYRYSDMHLQDTLAKGVDVDLAMDMNMLVSTLESLDLFLIIGSFVFFFIAGYLLYGALFAIVGSASDADTDTQQFIFPLTVPLLFSVMMTPNIISNPHGVLAKVMSFIPFSSPIVTMVRLPFADSNPYFYWELAGAMLSVIMGFILTTWMASRIYRVGILMYGQKIGYRELIKWFFYKE